MVIWFEMLSEERPIRNAIKTEKTSREDRAGESLRQGQPRGAGSVRQGLHDASCCQRDTPITDEQYDSLRVGSRRC